MDAILSIKPQFVEKIFSGEKQFEYRKAVFKHEVRRVYIYASAPVCRIVGDFEVETVLSGLPSAIWDETKEFSGIDETFFYEYFENHLVAHALKIRNLRKYNHSINPKERIKGFVAPQSYRYIMGL